MNSDLIEWLILLAILMINLFLDHNLTSKSYYASKIRKHIVNL